MSGLGQLQKSAAAYEMSGAGGTPEVNSMKADIATGTSPIRAVETTYTVGGDAKTATAKD